jgi:RNA polymerase sigma-70 factor (ECF subfamily)
MAKIPEAGREGVGERPMGSGMSDAAVSGWFRRSIIPLEAILMTYLRQNWHNPSDIADLRQEIYVRVYEAARNSIPEHPKRFLLTTARNLLIDRFRREQVLPMETFADFDTLGVSAEVPEPDSALIAREEVARLELALQALPPRTRDAISLAYFEGLNRAQIAARMRVTPQAVSQLLVRGTLLLGDALLGAPFDGKRQ